MHGLFFSSAERRKQKKFPEFSEKHIFLLKIIKKTHFY
jgi:hypothetical protein